MSIESCANFRREFSAKPPYTERVFCSVKGTDMGCNSYSDACPTPEFFIPKKAVERIGITFNISEALPSLVKICAWCISPGTEPPLSEGQNYTHGICSTHAESLLKERKGA